MKGLSSQNLSLHFSPFLPDEFIWVLSATALLLVFLSAIFTRSVPFLRLLTLAVFMCILLNPSLHEEQRESVPGIAVVIVDESASQEFDKRQSHTDAALTHLEKTLKQFDNIELRVARGPVDGALASRTTLYETLENIYADVPESRRAGVIFISDGQIHDVPDIETLQSEYGPVHLLLTGEKKETDRRIVITNAPAFGIVGQDITVEFRIEDHGALKESFAQVSLKMTDGTERYSAVTIGEDQSITLPVNHAGQNVFELSVEPIPGEITERNNKVALDFQGVRDRLRVLLVSGKPHAGGRTWRDLLTADPSVDLVHFTILREPEKIDSTPQSEMSLIAFPFRELFELKLYEFDLIIFDRYRLNRILPDHYFQNIARYVREGGAFLEASGPAFAGEDSVFYTALRDILPGTPTGDIFNQGFTPTISDKGQSHPVTRNLNWSNNKDKPWGEWQRQIGLSDIRGDVLMTGIRDKPLLILNRVQEGRAAHIASDHIWLWSRSHDGGGPHAELLRRTVHWLMKEPELDEEALDVRVDGRTLIIRRAAYERTEDLIIMTKPDGSEEEITLALNSAGILEHLHRADQTGIYRFESADGKLRFAVVGELDPLEFRNVLTSAEPLQPLLEKTGGKALWLSETATPRIRLRENGPFAGHNWLGLQNNNAYSVTGATEKPFLPPWLALCLLLIMTVLTWYYEGRKA